MSTPVTGAPRVPDKPTLEGIEATWSAAWEDERLYRFNPGAPREQVFDYLQDIANHPEFTDHYLVDWHLTRIDSVGLGAGARFRIKAPRNRFSWGDVTFAEVERPHRIGLPVGVGTSGPAV